MSVTHHRCPKQFRRCSWKAFWEHIVESTWEDPERDAEIGRKFNLWSAGCRESCGGCLLVFQVSRITECFFGPVGPPSLRHRLAAAGLPSSPPDGRDVALRAPLALRYAAGRSLAKALQGKLVEKMYCFLVRSK